VLATAANVQTVSQQQRRDQLLKLSVQVIVWGGKFWYVSGGGGGTKGPGWGCHPGEGSGHKSSGKALPGFVQMH
jgi:hypothetical protein